LSKTQEFITRINQLPLTKDEKLKIINYKPENIVEISVVRFFLLIIIIAYSKSRRKAYKKAN